MSLLWWIILRKKSKKYITKKLNQISKNPSPKDDDFSPAQGQFIVRINKSKSSSRFLNRNDESNIRRKSIKNLLIEGISLFTSSEKVMASMTVEAAILLPLFFFFFLNLSTAIELIRLHSNISVALYDVGRRLAIYEPMLRVPSSVQELGDVALSYTYVKNEIVKYLGKDYLEQSPIVDGVDGLHFWQSDILDENGCIDIIVTYKVEPFINIIGFRPFRMSNRYYAHTWSGYFREGIKEGEEGKKENPIVYITKYGTVYHVNRHCKHLEISVEQVDATIASQRRNAYGEIYKPCEICMKGKMKKWLYLTEDGNRMHQDRNCSGLKRKVYPVQLNQLSGYRPCMSCAGSLGGE